MERNDLTDLARRVTQLERSNGRWRRFSLASILILGAVLTMAFQGKDKSKGAKTLEISKLSLKSADGKARGWLVVRKDGIGLVFGDDNGARSGFVLGGDTAALKIFNQDGAVVAGVGVEQNGVITASKTGPNAVNSGLNALVNGTGNVLNAESVFTPPKTKP